MLHTSGSKHELASESSRIIMASDSWVWHGVPQFVFLIASQGMWLLLTRLGDHTLRTTSLKHGVATIQDFSVVFYWGRPHKKHIWGFFVLFCFIAGSVSTIDRVTSRPCLPKTERVLRTQNLHCWSWESPGKPGHISFLDYWSCIPKCFTSLIASVRPRSGTHKTGPFQMSPPAPQKEFVSGLPLGFMGHLEFEWHLPLSTGMVFVDVKSMPWGVCRHHYHLNFPSCGI